jgi:hypothetical protein
VPADMKTFSQLALPTEGAVSIAVCLGKLEAGPLGTTIHPPSFEYPPTWPLFGPMEATYARASLGYYLASLPGGPLTTATTMTVAIDVVVAGTQSPFYVVVPPRQPGGPIVTAFGVAHLSVVSSSGDLNRCEYESAKEVGECEVLFLEHREGYNGLFGAPIAMRQFTISQQLTLSPGTSWVFVGVELRLEVDRLFRLEATPPPAERDGFACIDLRSPKNNGPHIHYLLEPHGPVRVPSIKMRWCPADVLQVSTS